MNEIDQIKTYFQDNIGTRDTRDAVENDQYMGFTGLMYAVMNNCQETVNFLYQYESQVLSNIEMVIYNQIKNRKEPIATIPIGTSALQLAIICSKFDLTNWMIEKTCSINVEKQRLEILRNPVTSMSILDILMTRSQSESLVLIERYRIQIYDLIDDKYNTLAASVACGKPEFTNFLLSLGQTQKYNAIIVSQCNKLLSESEATRFRQQFGVQTNQKLVNECKQKVNEFLSNNMEFIIPWVDLERIQPQKTEPKQQVGKPSVIKSIKLSDHYQNSGIQVEVDIK